MALGAGNLVRIGEAPALLPKKAHDRLNRCQDFKPRPGARQEQEDSPPSER